MAPAFEDRTVEDGEGVPSTFRYLTSRERTLGQDELVWPSKLHTLGTSLGAHERLRVGVLRRGDRTYVAWAFPV